MMSMETALRCVLANWLSQDKCEIDCTYEVILDGCRTIDDDSRIVVDVMRHFVAIQSPLFC